MLLQRHLEYRLRTLNAHDQKTSTINSNQTGGRTSSILGKIGMLQRQNPTENKGGMMRFDSQTTQFAVYLPDSCLKMTAKEGMKFCTASFLGGLTISPQASG